MRGYEKGIYWSLEVTLEFVEKCGMMRFPGIQLIAFET